MEIQKFLPILYICTKNVFVSYWLKEIAIFRDKISSFKSSSFLPPWVSVRTWDSETNPCSTDGFFVWNFCVELLWVNVTLPKGSTEIDTFMTRDSNVGEDCYWNTFHHRCQLATNHFSRIHSNSPWFEDGYQQIHLSSSEVWEWD